MRLMSATSIASSVVVRNFGSIGSHHLIKDMLCSGMSALANWQLRLLDSLVENLPSSSSAVVVQAYAQIWSWWCGQVKSMRQLRTRVLERYEGTQGKCEPQDSANSRSNSAPRAILPAVHTSYYASRIYFSASSEPGHQLGIHCFTAVTDWRSHAGKCLAQPVPAYFIRTEEQQAKIRVTELPQPTIEHHSPI